MAEEKPSSMVAPKSREQKEATAKVETHSNASLQPVEQLAAERAVPAHALAGMRRANGWAEGKQVDAETFEAAMTAYINKPMGARARD